MSRLMDFRQPYGLDCLDNKIMSNLLFETSYSVECDLEINSIQYNFTYGTFLFLHRLAGIKIYDHIAKRPLLMFS